jgi:UDP-N-acetylmuramoyl-tripeptide--D-alanyl-D-alanine ligase
MTPLWASAEAEAATLGHVTQPFAATGVSIDTRSLRPGDLFLALKGDSRDGHEFVHAAFEAGASGAMVSRRPEGLSDSAPLLVVAHTQRGLEDLGRAARARCHAKLIAVTGSAGKTTTKEMLRFALGALGSAHASAASHNNHWGVPLSLAAMPRETDYAVLEIGMNHFGEIRSLVGSVKPHVALITTIAPAHLEFFGSCEAIADAKSEVFEGLVPGGVAVLPADSAYFERLRTRAKQAGVSRILSFGNGKGSDARIVSVKHDADGMKVAADVLGKRAGVHVAAAGSHIAANAIGALLAIAAAEGDVLNAAAGLSAFRALKGRGARFQVEFESGAVEVIDESYNANPASMAAALAVLAETQPTHGGRRIAVLGDMLEIGPDGPALHAALAQDIERAHVDLVFANGTQMRSLWDALLESRRGAYGPESGDIATRLVSILRSGDVVLVKGSFGSRMSVIIDALKAQRKAA